MKRAQLVVFLFSFSAALSQVAKPPTHNPSRSEKDQALTSSSPEQTISERALQFSPVALNSAVPLSPVTSLPQCASDGSLFIDMLDPKNLKNHTLIAITEKSSQVFSPASISDIHDVDVFGFFPAESIVGFLVRGTKGLVGTPGPGKSSAGYAWSDYHNYVAEFNRDGGYKGAIELPMSYQLSHLAILPSGEFLVSGYDQLNSSARLLFLDSSGRVLRALDLPASRSDASLGQIYGSATASRVASELIGSVVFTPYNQDILVWRKDSNDPILDVGPGGRVREVPLHVPVGFVFTDMVSANDRWVAHFRAQNTPAGSPFSAAGYSYVELRTQDASLSSKLLISGDVPQFLACEQSGTYTTFKQDDKDSKLLLFKAN